MWKNAAIGCLVRQMAFANVVGAVSEVVVVVVVVVAVEGKEFEDDEDGDIEPLTVSVAPGAMNPYDSSSVRLFCKKMNGRQRECVVYNVRIYILKK
jgi:hypothetical protein